MRIRVSCELPDGEADERLSRGIDASQKLQGVVAGFLRFDERPER